MNGEISATVRWIVRGMNIGDRRMKCGNLKGRASGRKIAAGLVIITRETKWAADHQNQ